MIQVSKLANPINLGGEISLDDGTHSSNFKLVKEIAENKYAPMNKAINSLETTEQLYKTCIESKYIRIVKSRGIMLTTRKLHLKSTHKPIKLL